MLIAINGLSFVKLLKHFRERKELSQEELAEKSGIKPAVICQIEKGQRKPSRAIVLRLVNGLGLSSRKANDLFLIAAGYAPSEETVSEILYKNKRTAEEETEWQKNYRLGKSHVVLIGRQTLQLW